MPQAPLRLFRHPLSGHSHRVELFLSLLGLPFELVNVNLAAGAHKAPEFLTKNVFGQLPVLEDGAFTLADSNAILVYLAERYDEAGRYYPRNPERRGEIQRWLSVAAGPLASGPGVARSAKVFGRKVDHAAAVASALQLFGVLEGELTRRPFIVGASATIADLALYAYTARAPEGEISLEPFPKLRDWLARIEQLPGFVPIQPAPVRKD